MSPVVPSPWAAHARVAALFGLCAGGVAFARGKPPAYDADALAEALGRASAGFAEARDLRWEPSDGPAADYAIGRFALFLASSREGAPRDVYRARVRLSPEGHPVSVGDVHNLTSTPLGDDHALVLRAEHAAFATRAYGQEQSVSVFDLSGEGAQNTTEKPADRAMAWVTNVQQTGSGAGVGRVDVSFDAPGKRVGLTMEEAALELAIGDDDGVRRARFDFGKGELLPGATAMHAEPARHLPKRFVFWAVDTVRAVPWIGPAPIAWLEERVFALKDAAKQAAFKLHGQTPEDTLVAPAARTTVVIDTSGAAVDDGSWPPRDIPSIWKTPEPGEGVWKPVNKPWMRRFSAPEGSGEAPSAFATTFVRPDESRPYSHVTMVAMDMRQLDLEMEAGTEDPKPLTGQHGPGRLPGDPAILQRVVACFNGAFKTEHGNYGMMVHKRVLLPPQPNAASVIVGTDGRAGLGSWGGTQDIGGLAEGTTPIPDERIASFRQNLDPLVDNGEVNPTGRSLWGYTLPGNGMQTERSGLCVTFSGHLVYTWGDDASATTLGKAMKMAGCDYGLHLDMNPHHTGFIFTTIRQRKGHDYKSELLTSLMEVSTDRYIEYAPKDFFYMLLRDPTPTMGSVAWKPDPGTQPAPSWSPGIWRARGERTEITLFEAGRADFRAAAGHLEPDGGTGTQASHELAPEDNKRVVWSITLGTAQSKKPLGLSTAGKRVLGDSGEAEMATLVMGAGETLRIERSGGGASPDPHTDIVELPMLADAGNVLPSADHAPMTHGREAPSQRAALGVTAEGRVLVATGDLPLSALAKELVALGAARVVALDRGAHATATVHRAGTSSPPVAGGDETTLFALGRPMRPRAFKFTSTKK